MSSVDRNQFPEDDESSTRVTTHSTSIIFRRMVSDYLVYCIVVVTNKLFNVNISVTFSWWIVRNDIGLYY